MYYKLDAFCGKLKSQIKDQSDQVWMRSFSQACRGIPFFSVFTCGFLGVFAKEEEGKERKGGRLSDLILKTSF